MEEAVIPTGATDDTTTPASPAASIPTDLATTDPAGAIRSTTLVTNNSLAKKPPQCIIPSKTKRRSALHLLKAAWLMLRGKDNKSKSLTASRTFARLFFSVRPLKLQHNALQAPPAPSLDDKGVPSGARDNIAEPPFATSVDPQHYDQAAAFMPLRHVASSPSLSSGASSSSGGMSRYASAQNLRELDDEDHGDDDCDEEGDGDAYYDGIEGDEMIDAKAEEFIAQFYQQMRLQQQNAGYGKASI